MNLSYSVIFLHFCLIFPLNVGFTAAGHQSQQNPSAPAAGGDPDIHRWDASTGICLQLFWEEIQGAEIDEIFPTFSGFFSHNKSPKQHMTLCCSRFQCIALQKCFYCHAVPKAPACFVIYYIIPLFPSRGNILVPIASSLYFILWWVTCRGRY